jgi:hypothetical protein
MVPDEPPTVSLLSVVPKCFRCRAPMLTTKWDSPFRA